MYVLKKISLCIFTMFVISIFLFIMLNLIPTDPVISKLGIERINENPRLAQKVYEEFELDKPVIKRYVNWAKKVFLDFDFGKSFTYDDYDVSYLIFSRLKYTLILSLYSFLLTVLLGITFGILIAKFDKTIIGNILNIFTQFGLSLPNFWVAILLLSFFGIKLKMASTHVEIIENDIIKTLKSFTLPVLTLVIGQTAIVSRYLKVALLDEKNKYYVMVAKSKGLTDSELMKKHILKNALMPVITIMGLIFISTLTGSIVIENVFSIPGIGTLLINAIKNSDYPLIQGIVFYYSFIVVFSSFILDIMYMIIDPRIRS